MLWKQWCQSVGDEVETGLLNHPCLSIKQVVGYHVCPEVVQGPNKVVHEGNKEYLQDTPGMPSDT